MLITTYYTLTLCSLKSFNDVAEVNDDNKIVNSSNSIIEKSIDDLNSSMCNDIMQANDDFEQNNIEEMPTKNVEACADNKTLNKKAIKNISALGCNDINFKTDNNGSTNNKKGGANKSSVKNKKANKQNSGPIKEQRLKIYSFVTDPYTSIFNWINNTIPGIFRRRKDLPASSRIQMDMLLYDINRINNMECKTDDAAVINKRLNTFRNKVKYRMKIKSYNQTKQPESNLDAPDDVIIPEILNKLIEDFFNQNLLGGKGDNESSCETVLTDEAQKSINKIMTEILNEIIWLEFENIFAVFKADIKKTWSDFKNISYTGFSSANKKLKNIKKIAIEITKLALKYKRQLEKLSYQEKEAERVVSMIERLKKELIDFIEYNNEKNDVKIAFTKLKEDRIQYIIKDLL